MGIQLRDHPLQYNTDRATDDRPLKALLPEGALSPQWLYKDKNTRGEWRLEEHRRGYDTDTLEDLWGAAHNEAEFRCSFYVYRGTTFFGVPVPEQVWGPPMKIHAGELGRTRPMLLIQAPDWDQKDHGITKRDNYAQIRVVIQAKVLVGAWYPKRGGIGFEIRGRSHGFDYRINPHSLEANRDVQGPPFDFITGEYAHIYRGTKPIILDFSRFKDIADYYMYERYQKLSQEQSGLGPGWRVEEGPWVFIDIKYGKDSRKLDINSRWNESFGMQRISHNHVNPWKMYENSHSHMLNSRYFDRLEV